MLCEYGPARVWLAGLSALKYPPTWADRFSEFEAIRADLIHNH